MKIEFKNELKKDIIKAMLDITFKPLLENSTDEFNDYYNENRHEVREAFNNIMEDLESKLKEEK